MYVKMRQGVRISGIQLKNMETVSLTNPFKFNNLLSQVEILLL